MTLALIIVLIVLALVLITCIGSIVSIYNGLVSVKNNVDKSWKNIEVLLKQRHDELPKLISVVKGYMKHEKILLEEITQARSEAVSSKSFHQRQQAENRLSGLLASLYAVSENYPELRSNHNFTLLQSRISGLENEIADRREFFNESVNNLNIRIESLPDMFLAKILGYEKKEMLNIPNADTKDVDVSF